MSLLLLFPSIATTTTTMTTTPSSTSTTLSFVPTYTYADLYASTNGRIHNKIGLLTNPRVTLNNAVRQCLPLKLRSTKRKAALAPNLFNDIFQYSCPSDLNGLGIIGLESQTLDRTRYDSWRLTTRDEFDRYKSEEKNLISLGDNDFLRTLLISANISDVTTITSNFDSLTGDGGVWSAFGDGTNVRLDTDNYVHGNSSLKFDLSNAGGTTAGVENAALNIFDLTNYQPAGSAFVWAWVTSASNLTNFVLKIGNNATNNYEMTATATNEGTGFRSGWNLIRFDFSGKTTNGTVSMASANFARLYMTKSTGKVNETDYRFDYLILKQGKIHNVFYYTKFMWQSPAGVYKENSTQDSDILNADTDEFDLLVEKATELAAISAREYDDYKFAQQNFKDMSAAYRQVNPDESLQLITTYHDL